MSDEKKESKNSKKEQPVDLNALSPEQQKQVMDQAFDKVCKQAGIDPKAVKAEADQKKMNEEMVDYVISVPVYINGEQVPFKGRKTRAEVETILQCAGAKRNRILEEKIGKNYELAMIAGSMSSKLVSAVDADGNLAGAQ